MIIYTITNKINGKKYVGRTVRSINLRMDGHRSAYKYGIRYKLYDAVREAGGWDNFEVEVIDSSAKTIEELNKLEAYYIEKFDTINNGYNMIPSGKYNPMDCLDVSERHDAKMRTSKVRNQISESMVDYRKDHPFDYAHRVSISENKRAFYASDAGQALLAKQKVERAIKRKELQEQGKKLTNKRSVYCVDELGNVVAKFQSIRDAALWWNSISNVCTTLNGYTSKIRRSCQQNRYYHGLKWYYE